MTVEESVSLVIDHSKDIVDDIASLFKSHDFSDIMLIVGDRQFLAHRVVLASRCDYFRALLFGGLAETHSTSVQLNGISSVAFNYVLEYIYTGKLSIAGISIEDAFDILGLACQYDLPDLQDELSSHFTRLLTLHNVCQIYDCAITYDLEDLIDACLQTIDRSPSLILSQPHFLKLSKASVIRMLSRDSFYLPELDILRGVLAWLETDHQSRSERFASLLASSSLSLPSEPNVSVNKPAVSTSNTNTATVVVPSLSSPLGRKSQFPGQIHTPGTRSNSSESLFSSASTSDSVTSAGPKPKIVEAVGAMASAAPPSVGAPGVGIDSNTPPASGSTLVGTPAAAAAASAAAEVLAHVERESAAVRTEVLGACVRFELLSLAELMSSEVRASRLFSPDDLLDKIAAKMKAPPNQLPLRGRMLLDVNLAVPRLGATLLKGTWGNYPFFFVDNAEPTGLPSGVVAGGAGTVPFSLSETGSNWSRNTNRRHRRGANASRSLWDASLVTAEQSSSNPAAPSAVVGGSALRHLDREMQLRGRGDALANASAWGFMDNVAVATSAAGLSASGSLRPSGLPIGAYYQQRDAASGPSGALMHLRAWLRSSASPVGALQVLPRTPHEPPPESEASVVSHQIGASLPECILVDLGHNSFVNFISMQLWDREPRSYSYYVEVSQTLAEGEEGSWQRVVDYRNHLCRSWQTLYFPARIVRYIRVVGTRSSVGKHFHLVTLQCLYTREKFSVQNGLLIPRNNVTTIHHGATVLEGVSRLRNSLIDGDVSVYNLNYGFTCHQLGNGSIDVQLSQPFLVSSMRFLLWDLDSRAYSYIVEVSQDRTSWVVVFDATQLFCRSWQTIKFPLQPVTFIRITGTGNTANDVFHLVHLECPASSLGEDKPSISSSSSQDHMTDPVASTSGEVRPPTVAASGPQVYVDAESVMRHQRPRLLEVEEPSTPSSSLVADLSTFSLHSEVTLDAAGTETGGESTYLPPPHPITHHQRRRRRRYPHGRHNRSTLIEDEDPLVIGNDSSAHAFNSTADGNRTSNGVTLSSSQYFSGNSRATSLSSMTASGNVALTNGSTSMNGEARFASTSLGIRRNASSGGQQMTGVVNLINEQREPFSDSSEDSIASPDNRASENT